jgi:16S rRNA (guanine(966)-N(2))-methyltransferase RsmD
MRVIAGTFRSRRLHSLPGLDIRPTSDRLRETLFNILTAGNPVALEGSVWVDLFAGSGAVGVEALSRGARMVYFVDNSQAAVEVIKRNLQALGITGGFQIIQQESARAIAQLDRQHVKPNFVFMDPPYSMRGAYQVTLEAVNQSSWSECALLIAEHDKRFDPGEQFGEMQRFHTRLQGEAGLSFYRRA